MDVQAIDKDAVTSGDRITWTTRNGGHEATGLVEFATRSGVHVVIPGRGVYLVEWERVESHSAA